MSTKITQLKKILDQIFDECICDETELRELEQIMAKIQYLIDYCYTPDQ